MAAIRFTRHGAPCYNIEVMKCKAERVRRLLDEHYGSKTASERVPVLDELILTILSQNTTAANCKRANARLRQVFATWTAVMEAPVEQVAAAIRVGGLGNIKAPRIQAVLRQVYDRQGGLDLEWLNSRTDAEVSDYLTGFDGVGPKTAACVLLFAMKRPVFPVDTHVHRIAMRLGLIGPVTAERAHELLADAVAPEHRYSFHVNLVQHGREICRAQRPMCEICPARRECDYGRQARPGGQ